MPEERPEPLAPRLIIEISNLVSRRTMEFLAEAIEGLPVTELDRTAILVGASTLVEMMTRTSCERTITMARTKLGHPAGDAFQGLRDLIRKDAKMSRVERDPKTGEYEWKDEPGRGGSRLTDLN